MSLPAPDRDSAALTQSLLACLPEHPERFKLLCAGVTDWAKLFDQEQNESVAGVLYHHLSDAGIDLPGPVKERLERRLTSGWLRLLKLRAALNEALSVLDSAALRAVALKGPVLAERLYPDPALRPCSDIDLLVAAADLDQAITALEAIGYRNEKGVLERYYRENQHHIPFYRPDAAPLELHFRATTGFGTVVPAEDFLQRARLYQRAEGPPAWVLAPEDEALYLLLHAARHLFLDVLWLYDLKLFFRRYPGLDWPLVAERARGLGVVSALSLAFEALDRRLGMSVPGRRYFEPRHKMLASLGRLTLAVTAKQPPGSGRETAGRMLFRSLLCDKPAASAWGFRGRLLRFARRRAGRYLGGLAPQRWAD